MEVARLEIALAGKDDGYSRMLSGANKELGNFKGKADSATKGAGFLKTALSFATGGAILQGFNALGAGITNLFSSSLGEAQEWQQGVTQLGSVLTSTGGKAGVTKEQVLALASSLSASGGLSQATDDAILAGQNMLLTFTNVRNATGVGNDIFNQATKAALDMATAMNNGAAPSAEQLAKTNIQLGKALNDPLKGMSALSKVGVAFTAQQKEQIKAMVAAGDVMGAQKLILAELGTEFGGAAAASAQTFTGKLTTLKEGLNNVKQGIGEALMPSLEKAVSFLASPATMGALQRFADGLVGGITKVTDFMPKAVGAISRFTTSVRTGFLGVLDDVKKGNFGAVISKIGDAFKGLTVKLPDFGALFTKAMEGIGKAAPNIGKFLGEWIPKIAEWFATRLPALVSMLGTWFTQAVQALSSVLPQVLSGLGSFLTTLVQGLATGIPAAVTAFLNIWTSIFTEVLPGLFGALGTLFSGIGDWISANGPALMSQMGEALGSMFGKLGELITTQGPILLDAIGSLIGNAFNWLIENIPTIINGIREFLWQGLQSIGTFLADNGPAILEGLGTVFTNITQWLGENVPKLMGMFGQLIGDGLKFIWDHGPEILEGLGKILAAIGGWIIGTALPAIGNMLLQWGQAFLDWIGPIVGQIPGKLGDLAGAIWTWIGQTVGDAYNKALEIGGKIIDGIGQGFMNFIGNLADAAVTIWNWITQTASDAYTKAVAVGGKIIDGIGYGFMAFLGNLGDMAQKIWDWISNTAVAAYNKAGEIGANIWKGIHDAFMGSLTFEDLLKGLEEEKQRLKGPGGNVFDGIKDAASNAIKAISSAFQNATIAADVKAMGAGAENALKAQWGIASPSRVFMQIGLMSMQGLSGGISAGGGLARGSAVAVGAGVRAGVAGPLSTGQFVAIGMNIGRGLEAGIRASGAQAVAAARSVAAQVANAARSTLGVKSPSKVFEAIGKNVNAGLAQGLSQNQGVLASTEASLASVVALAKRVVGKGTKELMEAFSSIVGAASGAFDFSSKLGSKDYMAPTRAVMDSFYASIEYIAVKTNNLLNKYKPMFTEAKAKLAEFGSQIVGAFTGPIDAIARLGDKDWASPSMKVVENYFRAVDAFSARTNHLIGKYGKSWDETRAQMAEFGSRVIKAFTDTVEGIGKLGDENWVAPTMAAIDSFWFAMDHFLHQMDFRLLRWFGSYDETKAKLAEAIGQAANGFLATIDGFAKLGSKEWAAPTQEAIVAFWTSMDGFLKEMDFRLLRWYGSYDATKSALAKSIGDATNGILATTGSFAALGKSDWVAPAKEAILAFWNAFDYFVFEMDFRLLRWWGSWEEVKVKTAGYIGDAVKAIGDAVAALAAIGKVGKDFPLVETVTLFWDALDAFWVRFKAKQVEWIANTGIVSSATAEIIGDAVSKLTGAVTGLMKLADPKIVYPSLEAINAFFDNLTLFIDRFASEAVRWKGKATEESAKLAGWVGDIAGNISKVLDPILKMADASKVTEQQIEGAMYGVWFALDQFNRVMSGGSAGTAFQGEWMTRAKAFATDIGTVFTELQKALSILSSTKKGEGGATDFFEGLRANWMAVFGPAQQEGTLLYWVLDRQVGFMKKLEEGMVAGLEFLRITVWGGRLDALKQDVVQKLTDMKPAFFDAGYALGVQIANGIVAGMNSVLFTGSGTGTTGTGSTNTGGSNYVPPGGYVPDVTIPPGKGIAPVNVGPGAIVINASGANAKDVAKEVGTLLETLGRQQRLTYARARGSS